ncbi:MAG: DUF2924 domain-containing protein [Oceanicaulis sp.]
MRTDPALHRLEDMSRDELTALWREMYEADPPRRTSAVHIRRMLSYEMQARVRGGLAKRTRDKLLAAARDEARPKAPGLVPGGRLIREWNGETHTVEVLDKGFSWRGRTYRSLSAIAEGITGVRWSGPRFFGLKRAAP